MIEYLQTDFNSFITLFHYSVQASNKREGIHALKHIVNQCRSFADAMQIHFHDDCFLFFDGEATVRLVFQVKEPQDTILIKMSALFGFAATLKLTLIGNEFLPENTH